ncbi:hypothetical protein [Candidatus Tisiphia endosymbiont of Ditula angustiorana]|uniref:hypothetical protein n=1 Tax=Candidatus Tisiphia endosymbiont of Ditula angustiorana TaxID=3066272 RepID=UPI00312C8966
MTIKEIFKKFTEYSELNVEDLKNLLVNRVNLLPINPLDSKKALVQNILKTPKNSTDPKGSLEKAGVIIDIMEKVVFQHTSDFLKGAHIMVEDNGSMYDTLKDLGLVKERISSHHRGNKAESDASVQAGEIFREFLVGKTKDGKTWFQLEAHSIGGLSNFVKHMIDYVTYVLTGKNVGQYGLSEHVDSKPITLNSKEVKEKTQKKTPTATLKFVERIEDKKKETQHIGR